MQDLSLKRKYYNVYIPHGIYTIYICTCGSHLTGVFVNRKKKNFYMFLIFLLLYIENVSHVEGGYFSTHSH